MSQPGFAGNSYILDIGADSAAFTPVLAKSTVRRLIIKESTLTSAGAANTLQGLLQYKIPNDGTVNGFTTIFQEAGADDLASQGQVTEAEIELGNPMAGHEYMGEVIGQLGQPIVGIPGGGLTAATTMIQLRSGTGTGTSVMITEYN